MKKELITIIAALCSLSMSADDVTPGITVSKTDGSSASGSRGQVPVTHMATQWEGLEEVPGMPNVNSL